MTIVPRQRNNQSLSRVALTAAIGSPAAREAMAALVRASGSAYSRQAPQNANQRARKTEKKTKKLEKKVKKIQQQQNASDATHVRRDHTTDSIKSNANSVTYADIDAFNVTNTKGALSSLRFFDPAAPGTLVSANGASGTYNRNYLFKNTSSSLTLKNGYKVPCDIRVYVLTPKDDTSITPSGAFTNGMTDQGNPTSSSPVIYPTDSEQFRKLWKIEKTVKKTLLAGKEMTVSHANKSFFLDPSNIDSHGMDYQRKYGAAVFLVRLVGCVEHQSGVDTQGLGQAGVDYSIKTTYKIVYDAGVNLEDYSIGGTVSTPGTTSQLHTTQSVYTA